MLVHYLDSLTIISKLSPVSGIHCFSAALGVMTPELGAGDAFVCGASTLLGAMVVGALSVSVRYRCDGSVLETNVGVLCSSTVCCVLFARS